MWIVRYLLYISRCQTWSCDWFLWAGDSFTCCLQAWNRIMSSVGKSRSIQALVEILYLQPPCFQGIDAVLEISLRFSLTWRCEFPMAKWEVKKHVPVESTQLLASEPPANCSSPTHKGLPKTHAVGSTNYYFNENSWLLQVHLWRRHNCRAITKGAGKSFWGEKPVFFFL